MFRVNKTPERRHRRYSVVYMLVSAIFYQIFILRQMIALQKL